jgi:hypothetical protein
MRFSMLLCILMRKLKKTAKKHPEFRQKLGEKDYTLVVKTADGKRGRSFTFSSGDIISGKADHPSPDISLVWRDAGVGFRVMSSGSNKAFMAALQDGLLSIQGEGGLALTFTGAVKDMMKLSRK